jgi:NADH dehydrogenase (ubiquinone) Fe-S protein 3
MLSNLYLFLAQSLPVLNIKIFKNEVVLVVSPKDLDKVVYFLKNSTLCQYTCIVAVSGVDYPERKNRFEVSYELLSVRYNSRIRVKTFINETTSLPSLTTIYKGANWWEREVWDLYGVYFKNHGDLRRILTDYAFQGHPMRKDFPLSGYVEVLYDEKLKRVVSQPLELTQDFRYFNYLPSWK